MKRIFSFLIFALSVCAVPGQVSALDPDDAQKLFEKKRYTAVWNYYRELTNKDSLNADLNYKMGVCYLNSRSQKEKAIRYFKRATGGDIGINGSLPAYKSLADACYLTGDFDQAMSNYEKYKKYILNDKGHSAFEIEEINYKMELCALASELKELKESVAAFAMHQCNPKSKNNNSLLNIGNVPVQRSLASVNFIKPHRSLRTFKDIDVFEEVNQGLKPRFDPETRKKDEDTTLTETTVATSIDGQIILIYRDEKGEANFYTSFLNGNQWTVPEKLDRNINNTSWEPNEFISADGNTMYFSNEREGGFGGKDIYKCVRMSNGEWGKAKNLGPEINSKFNEEAAFIHPDGRTLYFSSDRKRTNGYFDNFVTILSDSSRVWSVPVPAGYPFYKQVKTKAETKERNAAKIAEKENYMVTFNSKEKVPITLIKRHIRTNKGNIPVYTEVTVSNNETGDICGVYHPDPATGKLICIVPSEKNTNVTYEAEGYLFYSENINITKETNFYELQKAVKLVPIEVDSKITLNNIFFEEGQPKIAKASELELNRLMNFLNSYPKVNIELSVILDKKSLYDEIRLTEDKLKGLAKYLTDNGISEKRLEDKVYFKQKKNKKKAKVENDIAFGKVEMKILNIK